MMTRLENELRGSRRFLNLKRLTFFFIFLSLVFGISGGFFFWIYSDLPEINALEKHPPAESSKVYSSDGRLLSEFFVERRTFIPHFMLPEHLKNAVLSIEDIRFYGHPGVDFLGIFRALYHNLLAHDVVEGGSTITQQLAKMLFLKPERNIRRKIREAVLSIQVEKRYTKNEILGLYLNQAYFGARAYGIEAASQTYFGKSVGGLTLAEAALLAALPKAPSQYSPFKNPSKAIERRAIVLKRMLKYKFITASQCNAALKEPIPKAPHYRRFEAPYFVEYLRQTLEPKYSDDLYKSGYKIYTTLDSKMQAVAEASIYNGIAALEKRVKPRIQAALIAIDLNTGGIKALVGGSDFWETQFNRATHALRQTGSAFKPFVYLTAIMNGMTSTDTILDAPIILKGARPNQEWAPKNYDNKYHGNVSLKTAMAKSLNAATVRLAQKIGIINIINTAMAAGIKSELKPYLSTALGASDVTLMDIAFAYSVFADGRRLSPQIYEKIVDRRGIILDEPKPVSNKIIDKDKVNEMHILLNAVIKEGTAQKALQLNKQVFGKTGTTNEYTDAWFIGFDDKLIVGVWVGRDDHTPIGPKQTGAAAALPIWMEFMKESSVEVKPSTTGLLRLPLQNPLP